MKIIHIKDWHFSISAWQGFYDWGLGIKVQFDDGLYVVVYFLCFGVSLDGWRE